MDHVIYKPHGFRCSCHCCYTGAGSIVFVMSCHAGKESQACRAASPARPCKPNTPRRAKWAAGRAGQAPQAGQQAGQAATRQARQAMQERHASKADKAGKSSKVTGRRRSVAAAHTSPSDSLFSSHKSFATRMLYALLKCIHALAHKCAH